MDETRHRFRLGLPSKYPLKCVKCLVLSPTIFVLIIFISLVWIVFEAPNLLPAKPAPPEFMWQANLTRNVSAYINPSEETNLMTPKYGCLSSTKVLFIVPSSVNNSLRREAIRKTWGLWIINSRDNSTRLVFMLGMDPSWNFDALGDQILEEQSGHNDLIVEDFIDSYTNLTLKTVFILKWVHQKCPNVQFVLKVDDDMFINVPNLLRALSKVKPPAILGSLICNAHPIHNRWSKWYSPPYMFAGKYPNYLSGTSYVLSGDLIPKLLTAAIQTPYFHLEDIYLTGLCARKIGVRPKSLEGFSYLSRSFNPCIFHKIIVGHELTPVKMNKMWNMLHNRSIMKKCKPVPKKYLVAPSSGKCKWK